MHCTRSLSVAPYAITSEARYPIPVILTQRETRQPPSISTVQVRTLN